MGDNLLVDVQAKTRETFLHTFQLVEAILGPARGYIEDPEKGLVFIRFFGSKTKGHQFPCDFNGNLMADVAWNWLREQWEHKEKLRHSSDLGGELHRNVSPHGGGLDHDGHNQKGWRVYNETWGHVGEHTCALVAVQPAYIWQGK